ncbi:MAG: phosphatase [Paludibacteraceae bacterium]|nr:phosphatase [Paludibacteraceae bacterium]
MKAILDVHTHTVMSGHAYSTIQEMAQAAAMKGLKVLGITDHGPAMPDACHPMYFRNFGIIPRELYGVKILMGAELNILDYTGALDFEEEDIDKLDIRIAGIHRRCYQKGSIEENTTGMINVIKNKKIDIISHPADGTAELLFEPIVLASKEYGTVLEINNSSLNPDRKKEFARSNNLEVLRLCKKYEVPIIMGSDAHISFDVGRHERVLELIQEAEFPDELILNDKIDELYRILSLHNG